MFGLLRRFMHRVISWSFGEQQPDLRSSQSLSRGPKLPLEVVTDSATEHHFSWSICRLASGSQMDNYFFCCRAKGQKTAGVARGSTQLLVGEEGSALLQSPWVWPQHPAGPPRTNTSVCTSRGDGCTTAARSSLSPG